MTRINLIPPAELCNKHLLAEYRELPRIFRAARVCKDAPKQYVLGPGHVKFFYDKLLFLANRQKQLIEECLKRGFNVKFSADDLRGLNHHAQLWNDYTPTEEAISLSLARINERLTTMKGA